VHGRSLDRNGRVIKPEPSFVRPLANTSRGGDVRIAVAHVVPMSGGKTLPIVCSWPRAIRASPLLDFQSCAPSTSSGDVGEHRLHVVIVLNAVEDFLNVLHLFFGQFDRLGGQALEAGLGGGDT